jgi:hypothetical protein
MFFPIISYYHVLISFIEKPPSVVFRLVAAAVLVAFVGNIFGVIGVKYGMTKIRISDLPRANESAFATVGDFPSRFDVCSASYDGLSAIQMIGLALGPYDVEDNPAVFDLQMEYFFGSNWTDIFSYEVFHVHDADSFIAYQRKADGLMVFAFRGFSSGAETALHAQIVAQEFILPVVTDMAPLYGSISGLWLSWWLGHVQILSQSWVNPAPPVQVFMDKITKAVDSSNSTRLMFTGINIGGLFAKALGMKYGTVGMSFLSFPIVDDLLGPLFDIDEKNALFVTNIHTFGGVFTAQEPQTATNFGIPWIGSAYLENVRDVAGLSDFKVGTVIRDSVYRSFCILSEICGRNQQFGPYCEEAIGERDLLFIRSALHDQFGINQN